jgi:hypothetical protein
MADQPYRGTHATLDAAARGRAAAAAFARWRLQLVTAITLAFVVGGVAVALGVYAAAGSAQQAVFGTSYAKLGMLVGIVAWCGAIALGKVVARRVAMARTGAAVKRIAAERGVAEAVVEEAARRAF